MKLNRKLWELYCSSPDHQFKIGKFQDAYDACTLTELLCSYNQHLNIDWDLRTEISEVLYCYNISDFEDMEICCDEDAAEIFHSIISHGLADEDGHIINPGDYKNMMQFIPDISLWLSSLFPDYFFPYLFIANFNSLVKIADLFDIEIPSIPKKTDYENRCMYYWELCKVFNRFRNENGMTMPELASFIYDFVPDYFVENYDAPNILRHGCLWISGGVPDFGLPDECYWGCNTEAKPGDLLLIYQTAPVSGISAMYLIMTNGETDPFGTYHSYSKVKKICEFPSISLEELKQHPYFSSHSLIRRKFQGVNGTLLSATDYDEILSILNKKGFDVSILPCLDSYQAIDNKKINVEKDVEEQLLIPLLSKFGLVAGRDYIRQLPIHAGRGNRIYPDFALYFCDSRTEPAAKILIEAKLHIKNNKERVEAFVQAKSYANLLQSHTLVLCDDSLLIVYPKREGFNRNYYEEFHWSELLNPDRLSKLRKYLTNNKIL